MTEERVERRLAAILAADVVGYSRLVSADESDALTRLSMLRRAIIEPNIAGHSGRLFKVMGDGFLAEFASAVQAISCALAIQTETEAAASGFDDAQKIRLRIGIHVGDVLVEGDDLMGDGINIAVRLESIAAPGGISISRAVHDQVRDRIKITFDDKGEVALKNIARPVQVFAVAGAKSAAPVKATPSALALPEKPSIAVLPFQNMSGDPEQEYFADGMVEDIITALSRYKSLFVIARTRASRTKARPSIPSTSGGNLASDTCSKGASGSQADGSDYRTAHRGGDGNAPVGRPISTGLLDDVFELQDKVTSSVVGSIAPSVTRAEMERAKRKSPNDLNAYDCFLRGQSAMWRNTKDGTDEAINLYEQAVALDSRFAAAYAGVATGLNQRIYQQWSAAPASDMSRAMECARHALSLNPEEHTTLARIAWVFSLVGGGTVKEPTVSSRRPLVSIQTEWTPGRGEVSTSSSSATIGPRWNTFIVQYD